MRLDKLHIINFRKIEDLEIQFPRGLTIIVGENNTGKTTIIDALRLVLFSSRDFDALRLNEDDFRKGKSDSPIEISCTFCDLNEDEEVHFGDCLVDIGNGKFQVKINVRAEFNFNTQRVNVKIWGGETEGGVISSKLYDKISSIYLQPLRDPESGLRPGRHSQISRLINCLTRDDEQIKFESIANEANDKMRELPSVIAAKKEINDQMTSISSRELSQNAELEFIEPTFLRIIAGLQPKIEGIPFSLNGLGYNNLWFTAATLGTLGKSEQYFYRSILIEEPEAHLHPQLQVLLLKYLSEVSKEKEGNKIQVIASTHSPILASQAPIDSIISVYENQNKVTAISICTIDYDEILKKKLQRFLDATRAELFFARRILMVEGIAEVILLPIFAIIAGGSLKDSGVTILNVMGINFNAFLPLFGKGCLDLPVVILTDGDSKDKTGNPTETTRKLKSMEETISNFHVEFNKKTFEHELAMSKSLFPYLLTAFKSLHRNNGERLKASTEKLTNDEEKADAFLNEFIQSKTSKGEFAQELAKNLEEANLSKDAVPQYILNAFYHLGVIKNNEKNDSNREVTLANSVSETD